MNDLKNERKELGQKRKNEKKEKGKPSIKVFFGICFEIKVEEFE